MTACLKEGDASCSKYLRVSLLWGHNHHPDPHPSACTAASWGKKEFIQFDPRLLFDRSSSTGRHHVPDVGWISPFSSQSKWNENKVTVRSMKTHPRHPYFIRKKPSSMAGPSWWHIPWTFRHNEQTGTERIRSYFAARLHHTSSLPCAQPLASGIANLYCKHDPMKVPYPALNGQHMWSKIPRKEFWLKASKYVATQRLWSCWWMLPPINTYQHNQHCKASTDIRCECVGRRARVSLVSELSQIRLRIQSGLN